MGTPPQIMMANLGMADTLILLVLALVVFGPRRLPQIGRQVGKLMYEFRKASNDFKFQMEEELRNAEEADRRKKQEEERQRALTAAPPQPQQVEQTTSPAPGSNAAAPGSGAPAPAAPEVPYADPYEGLYQGLQQGESQAPRDPNVDSGTPRAGTPRAEAAAAPAEQPFVPPFVPRIQPPSTGETVSAERPGTEPQQQELFSAEPGKAPESANSEAVGSGPEAERSEPAAHHG
jgi:sec-independent protein translocase protein TatB